MMFLKLSTNIERGNDMTREEAIEHLKWYFECDNGLGTDKETVVAYKMAIKALDQIKTELEPKTGHWIHWTDDRKDYVTCSCCEYGEEGEVLLNDKTPFCPMCGAKMERGE